MRTRSTDQFKRVPTTFNIPPMPANRNIGAIVDSIVAATALSGMASCPLNKKEFD
jgi:hypothetical protein